MTRLFAFLLAVLFAGLIVAGVAFIYWPAALIAAGAFGFVALFADIY